MNSNDNMDAGSRSSADRLNELAAENAILQNALNAEGVGTWSWDLKDAVRCDVETSRLLGLKKNGQVAVSDFLVPFKDESQVQLLEALDGSRMQNVELDEVLELDGNSTRECVAVRLHGKLSEDGQQLTGSCRSVGVVAKAHDVSSDDESLRRVSQFMALSSDLYIELGYDGCVQWSNTAREAVLGLSQAELYGRFYHELLHPEDIVRSRQLVERIIAETKRTGEILLTEVFENRCRGKDGAYRWLSWTWKADAKRRLIYMIGRDVTETKFQRERLQATLVQVQHSNAELQSFASVASHDLREPLRMISSYLRLLEERSPDALDARAQRYINYACEGADRMRTLIEDLLSYSRLGSSERTVEPVALDEVLEEAIGHLAVSIQRVGAEVTVDIDNSPVVLGDRNQLVRLFQNLLGNSIKFHLEGSTPLVSVRFLDGDFAGEPGRWVVTIQDNGIGIDPDHQELLFNVFQRLNTRDEYEGSGIGLAVCRKIVDQHDGRIWVASEPGRGSTFYVTLTKLQAASISG